jgi:AraC family transcriptional regulator
MTDEIRVRTIRDALVLVEDNLGSSWLTLDWVAGAVGYSPSRFSKLFHFVVGDTFKSYVAERRLTRCAEELISTDMPVIDIATKWNFSSQSTFTRGFRTMFGMPPAQYRRTHTSAIDGRPSYVDILANPRAEISKPRVRRIKGFGVVCMPFPWDFNTGYHVREWWAQAAGRLESIPGVDLSHRLGLCHGSCCEETQAQSEDATEGGGLVYLASLRIHARPSSLPEDTFYQEVPGGDYVVFTIDAPLESVLDSCRYIWGTWIPRPGIRPLDAIDFDVYPPEAFDPIQDERHAPYEVWYPIERIPSQRSRERVSSLETPTLE